MDQIAVGKISGADYNGIPSFVLAVQRGGDISVGADEFEITDTYVIQNAVLPNMEISHLKKAFVVQAAAYSRDSVSLYLRIQAFGVGIRQILSRHEIFF